MFLYFDVLLYFILLLCFCLDFRFVVFAQQQRVQGRINSQWLLYVLATLKEQVLSR